MLEIFPETFLDQRRGLNTERLLRTNEVARMKIFSQLYLQYYNNLLARQTIQNHIHRIQYMFEEKNFHPLNQIISQNYNYTPVVYNY